MLTAALQLTRPARPPGPRTPCVRRSRRSAQMMPAWPPTCRRCPACRRGRPGEPRQPVRPGQELRRWRLSAGRDEPFEADRAPWATCRSLDLAATPGPWASGSGSGRRWGAVREPLPRWRRPTGRRRQPQPRAGVLTPNSRSPWRPNSNSSRWTGWPGHVALAPDLEPPASVPLSACSAVFS